MISVSFALVHAIVGMRHRLVRAYVDIDLDVLWLSVNEKLPALAEELRSALTDG